MDQLREDRLTIRIFFSEFFFFEIFPPAPSEFTIEALEGYMWMGQFPVHIHDGLPLQCMVEWVWGRIVGCISRKKKFDGIFF